MSFADALRGSGVLTTRARDEAEFAARRAIREYVAEHDGCTIAEVRHALGIERQDWLDLTRIGVRGVRLRMHYSRTGPRTATLHAEEESHR